MEWIAKLLNGKFCHVIVVVFDVVWWDRTRNF
jgi:hypothetical protein